MFHNNHSQNFSSSLDSEVKPEAIHKNIHLIWLGSIVRSHHIERIKEWKKTNPAATVTLWVDAEFQAEINKQFPDAQITIKSVTLLQVPEPLANWIHALTEARDDESVPNFAAASDIYRFLILNDFGGWYVDTDIFPFEVSAIKINQQFQFHIFATRKDKNLNELSPCVIASKPKSILTLQALKNLMLLCELYNDKEHNFMIRNNIASIRMFSTFITTGYALRSALRKITIDGQPIISLRNSNTIANTALFDEIALRHECILEQSWILPKPIFRPNFTRALPGIMLDAPYWAMVQGASFSGKLAAPYKDLIYARDDAFIKMDPTVIKTTKSDKLNPFRLFANKAIEFAGFGTTLNSKSQQQASRP